MSASRTERDHSRVPYDKLNDDIAVNLPTIEKRLVSSARSWDQSTILNGELIDILAKVEGLNKKLGRLVGVISLNPDPSTQSTSTLASTSEVSTSSLHAYHSPSGSNLLTTSAQPMLVDCVSSVPVHDFSTPTPSDIPDVVMHDGEAIARAERAAQALLYQAERLLTLSRLYKRPTIKKFNVFNQNTTGLDNLMPMTYSLILSGRFLLIIKDLTGRGWTLVLEDTTPSDEGQNPSLLWPSPVSWLALQVMNSLVVHHNARALAIVHQDVALQNRMRLLEPSSVKILKGSMYLVETGLLESRLDLHTFIREYMVLKISNGWFWFHKTFSEYDSAAQRRVIMPSLGDVVRGCTTGRFAIEDLVKKPFGEDNEGGLYGEINTLVTLICTGFYYAEGGIAYQACLLEAKYPGITGEKGKRPFIDFFPLSAFCMVLAFVLVVLQEISLQIFIYIDYNADVDHSTVPTLDELMTLMGTRTRFEPITKRRDFLALYDALLPHAKVLEPLTRQAKLRSAVWVKRLSPVTVDDMD